MCLLTNRNLGWPRGGEPQNTMRQVLAGGQSLVSVTPHRQEFRRQGKAFHGVAGRPIGGSSTHPIASKTTSTSSM